MQGGTTRWMSPELLDPEVKDHRRTVESDCYALGMVIYEVLNERVPFYGYRNEIISGKVLRGGRPDKPEGAEGGWFTDDVWEILERCWMPQPGDRPSINEILQRLERVSTSWTPPPVPPIAVPFTQESPDIILVESTDSNGILTPSEVAPYQLPVELGPEGAAGIVNVMRVEKRRRSELSSSNAQEDVPNGELVAREVVFHDNRTLQQDQPPRHVE